MEKRYKVNIKKMARFINNVMALVGFLLVYGSASTTDFHVMQLGVKAPECVWTLFIAGLVLMIPTILRLVYKMAKER